MAFRRPWVRSPSAPPSFQRLFSKNGLLFSMPPEWWNWQTRRSQKPLMETSWGFDSPLWHQHYTKQCQAGSRRERARDEKERKGRKSERTGRKRAGGRPEPELPRRRRRRLPPLAPYFAIVYVILTKHATYGKPIALGLIG